MWLKQPGYLAIHLAMADEAIPRVERQGGFSRPGAEEDVAARPVTNQSTILCAISRAKGPLADPEVDPSRTIARIESPRIPTPA